MDYAECSDSPHPLRAPPSNEKLKKNCSREHALPEGIKYDYYNESCPLAERIIRSTVRELCNFQSNAAPSLLGLDFDHCSVKGYSNHCYVILPIQLLFSERAQKEAPLNVSGQPPIYRSATAGSSGGGGDTVHQDTTISDSVGVGGSGVGGSSGGAGASSSSAGGDDEEDDEKVGLNEGADQSEEDEDEDNDDDDEDREREITNI
ncbi:PREDICTED: uncharacterized protein LOC105975468 [Erythranthe guttata]|uniref:uncharacterized protein LOC105975468 n=1 Tax=Erythranthe guttata TaxID=4155 RepID=UPI00064D801C|nr:PREDICTED: uncharacterized protein LOC105975468 [Erythranthe guttata]|eukprot:XP_012856120.1 PREDICTED: uncharacterized protein LOC105975468 [Erythranthe guttata]